MNIDEEDYLAHYGTPRKSGRYPWGTGGNESGTPRSPSFLDTVQDLRRQGVSDPDIARGLGIGSVDRNGEFKPSTTQLRAKYTIARNEAQQAKISMAQSLHDKAYSNGAIAIRMGLPGESSVRALLADGARDRANVLTQTSDMLQRQVDEKTFIDIGVGVENYLGVSQQKLGAAVAILKEKGYEVHTVPVRQLGTGKDTKVKVLAPPGTTWGDVRRNQDNIKSITEFTSDRGRTYNKTRDPLSIDPNRLEVKFKEDGGDKADGVVFVRPGVPDVTLGGSRYSQVRVKVGPDHFIKGMAMYKEDLPPGVDLQFNTNKTRTPNKLDALKKLEKDEQGNLDPDLPFGSVISRQILDKPGHPDAKATSVMNLVNEEGKWAEWSNNLSSQMLSKQSPALAKTQLDITLGRRKIEFDEIMALTNPTIKKDLLEQFALSADSAAVHLKAASLPRQATHVIMPLASIKPTEIYAPRYNNGDRVVLIRFPHGGTFEIPELTVNNKNPEGRKNLGTDTKDVVGIHYTTAKHLSGADFDGDTVLVIPNKRKEIKVSAALQGLKDFDPQTSYPPYDGMRTIDGGTYNATTKTVDYGGRRPITGTKNQEMGNISNLITDMTIKNASHEQIAKAVRHSMVVIDAEKHHLNYRLSAQKNGIRQLKEEYQGKATGGASTLISKKKSYDYTNEIKLRPQAQGGPIDKETGARVWVESGKTRLTRDGERIPVKAKINRLDITNDAHTLSSGTPMEKHYADHSNALKAMANRARLEALPIKGIKREPSAARVYANEVASLKANLLIAERNAPRERQAQIIANAQVKAKRIAHPDISDDTLKKVKFKALEEARDRLGAGKIKVEVTQAEWNAIQAGAISNNMLVKILKNTDKEAIRAFATPRRDVAMTDSYVQRAELLFERGYTRAEVAADLGVSLTTLDKATTGAGAS